MGILHHLAITPDQCLLWQQFCECVDAGDEVILLDQAARSSRAVAAAMADHPSAVAARWRIPQVERHRQGSEPLPPGVTEIADADWWSLIATHTVVLEWN